MRLDEHKKRASKTLAPYKNKSMDKKVCIKISETMKSKKINVEENNPLWKGSSVGYGALHKWVKRKYGKASKCEAVDCNGKSKRFEWANISGEYKRDREDFKELCHGCHRKFDHKMNNYRVK